MPSINPYIDILTVLWRDLVTTGVNGLTLCMGLKGNWGYVN